MTLEMLAQEEVAAVNPAARLVPIVPEVGKPYYKAEAALLASALSQLSVRGHYPLGVGEKEYNTQRRRGF